MIKKTFIGIITLILVSCGSDHTDFSGDWIDKEKESDKMIISKNGDNYIVENRNKKFPAQIKDGLLEISTEMPIKATIDENDVLIINGKEYIRFEKATKPKFEGVWGYNERSKSFIITFNDRGALTVKRAEKTKGSPDLECDNRKITNIRYKEGKLIFSEKCILYGRTKEDYNIIMTLKDDNTMILIYDINPEYERKLIKIQQ